jgi:hypothetical protein
MHITTIVVAGNGTIPRKLYVHYKRTGKPPGSLAHREVFFSFASPIPSTGASPLVDVKPYPPKGRISRLLLP